MARISGACAAALLAAGFAAADDKKPPPKGEDVTGTVTLDGRPLPGATVTFASKDGKTTVAAEVKDGRFVATVPAGEYAVAIAPPPPKDPKDPPPKNPPVIPARYGDPKTSGLVMKVAAGKNEVNFDLKSK